METTLRSYLARGAAAALVISLAACGGGSHSALPQAPSQPPVGSSTYTGPTGDATFKVTIPGPSSTSARKKPAYVSSATKSIKVTLTAATALTAGQISAFSSTLNVTPGSAACPGTTSYTCTFIVGLPPGTDSIQVTTYDANGGTGNVLSQQILASETIKAGILNGPFAFTFDANAAAMAITAQSGYCASSFVVANAGTVGTVGTSPTTFTAAFTDAAGKTIVSPGLPTIEIEDNTSTWQSASGTINGTGGTVSFSINQSAQTFTLTPGSSPMTGATINLKAVPPSGSDGLSFSKPLSFTFDSGIAPPHSLLAVAEQTGTSTRSVNFFTVNTSTGTFAAYSTPTLSDQSNDVDNPQDMVFDSNADLMIANGGAGSPDLGNFACVPAGSITTGANNATVVSNGIDDPAFIALGTNGNVAIGNTPAAADPHVAEYAISGTYAALSSSYNITQANYPSEGTQGLAALSAYGLNSAGTFAASITDDSATAANSHVVIKYPGGTSLASVANSNVLDPVIGADPANHEIVAASQKNPSGTPINYLTFFNDQTLAVDKQITIADWGCYSLGTSPYAGCSPQGGNTADGSGDIIPHAIAVSSSGYVAVAGGDSYLGQDAVWVYDNSTSTRYPVGGPLPYDGTTASLGTTLTYGGLSNSSGVNIVTGMRWLTGTVLLVSLESTNGSGTATSANGLYMYDVTQTGVNGTNCSCYDDNGTAYPNSIKQIGFKQLTNVPWAAAFNP